MTTTRYLCSLALCASLAFGTALSAQEKSDPLRLVPAQAHFSAPVQINLVVKIEQPSRAVRAFSEHEIVRDLLKIDAVRNLYDTTNFRQLFQLRDYFEKKLGVSGLEMLERLTGGGVVLAVKAGDPKAGGDNSEVLLVVQSKDETLLKKFVQTSVEFLQQELARKESKDKVVPHKFGKVDGYRLGDVSLAVRGATLLLASHPKVLQAALDLSDKETRSQGDKETKKNGHLADQPNMKDARKLLPKDPLVWAWIDLDALHKNNPEFKAGLDALRLDTNAQFLFGGLVNVVRRSPFAVSSLSQEGKNFVLETRLPQGRKGMDARSAMFLPQDDKGSLRLLNPPRTLASASYYLDLKAFWENRAKLLSGANLKGLEEFDENSGRFLGGTKLSTLLTQSGPHQRLVVALPLKSPYSIKPEQPIPAFALVQEMRDKEFGKSMETILREGGLLASIQFNLKMVEEKHGSHKVVWYRFDEKSKLPGDDKNFRFNFSPSFCIVGDQLIVSSTAELAHDLCDSLEINAVFDAITTRKAGTPSTAPAISYTSPATTRIALYAKGGAEVLRSLREPLLAQAILKQALPPEAARKQLDALIDLVERLGVLRMEIEYGPNDFRHVIRWQYK